MKDIYEFTDDELDLIKELVEARINILSKINKSYVDDHFSEYMNYTWSSTNSLLSKIETIRTFRQGNIDIDANIATELE